MGKLGDSLTGFSGWRSELSDATRRYTQWMSSLSIDDPSMAERMQALQDRLARNKLTIAFVAEFSRGKSELINAIFFGDQGRRILPSAAGRTTMCPTELYYASAEPIGMRLLPIETRLRDLSVEELKKFPNEWQNFALFDRSSEKLAEAFQMVRDTKVISADEAQLLGFDLSAADASFKPDASGMVQVPRWRHALVNVPHPLLEMGLVVIDTPGLNAIGLEPELTLSMIPSADAVVFVLAADTGVTQTDINVWRDCISPSHQSGRLVVLNKIDGLWDNIRDDAQIERELMQQVISVATTLQMPAAKVYPVSAQKALSAKVNADTELLKKSRLPILEAALANEIVPQQQAFLTEYLHREFSQVRSVVEAHLGERRRQVVEQLFELSGLRGKNSSVVSMMSTRVNSERQDFEKSVRQLQGLRAVFTRESDVIRNAASTDALKRHVGDAREAMKVSRLSSGLKEGMNQLLSDVQKDFAIITKSVQEVSILMAAMYKSFNSQHGLTLGQPMIFSAQRYVQEIERIDALQRQQFGTISMVTTERWALMRRFFETVAARLKDVYERARRDLDVWLRAVMAPIEGQVREHQAQLKRRVESLQRIRGAEDTLEVKIIELEENRAIADQQLALCKELTAQVMGPLQVPFADSSSQAVIKQLPIRETEIA